MDKSNLLQQLHRLRIKLHELVLIRGSLTDPDVIALSEEADRLIVLLQRLQLLEQQSAVAKAAARASAVTRDAASAVASAAASAEE